MKNKKYTPGEWRTDVPDPAFVNYDVRTDDTIICTMGIDMGTDEEKANAFLMSAAPDMLSALNALRTANGSNDFEGWHPSFREAIEKARAAIAKANQQ